MQQQQNKIQVKVKSIAEADSQQAIIPACTHNITKNHQHPRQMHQSGNIMHAWQLADWQQRYKHT